MAIRDIVRIDEDLCDGCGECVPSCAEGAIRIVDGKARLVAENLCDGLGACLGTCPQGAITVEARAADAFDEDAVRRHLSAPAPSPGAPAPLATLAAGAGCPGARAQRFAPPSAAPAPDGPAPASALGQWPVQLHLLAPAAPFLRGAHLLLAADCVPCALPDFHGRLLAGRALAIACPKLDHGRDVYLAKLTAMIDEAGIEAITVAVMEVPCCRGLLALAEEAAARASRSVPVRRVVVGTRGRVLDVPAP